MFIVCAVGVCCWCAFGVCCWCVLLVCADGVCCWCALLVCVGGVCCWCALLVCYHSPIVDDELQFYVMYRDQEAKCRIHTGIERISITSSKNGTISVYVTGITSL